MKFTPATPETIAFALPIFNDWLAANPIRKRKGNVTIPHKTLKPNDIIDWVYEGITEEQCIDEAREYANAVIEDMIEWNSREHQEYLEEVDAVNREMYG